VKSGGGNLLVDLIVFYWTIVISTHCVYRKNDNNTNAFIVIKKILYSLIKSTYINYRVHKTELYYVLNNLTTISLQ